MYNQTKFNFNLVGVFKQSWLAPFYLQYVIIINVFFRSIYNILVSL